jgi:hypothetical protein
VLSAKLLLSGDRLQSQSVLLSKGKWLSQWILSRQNWIQGESSGSGERPFFFFCFLGPVIILNAGRVAATATVANVSDYKTRMEFRHWFY